jgi:hypothetical protein
MFKKLRIRQQFGGKKVPERPEVSTFAISRRKEQAGQKQAIKQATKYLPFGLTDATILS